MSLWIRELTAGYRHRTVLERIALQPFPEGSLIGVIGRNGAGKSTLLKSLAGLQPYRGEVLFDNQPISLKNRGTLASQLGYLPQSLPQPTSLIAYETVFSASRAVINGFDRAKLEAAIERVFATLGIRDLALRKLSELSGGQRQMIGLAQVLVRSPRLLLLDEPTSALDLHWQLNVLNSVRDVTREQGATAMVAIHDINLALRFCDQLLVLGQGGVLAQGPAQEVLTPQVLREAYGIEGRIERCSNGTPIVLCDRAIEH